MASLYEYFVKDGSSNMTFHETWAMETTDGSIDGKIIARLHLDYEANAKYISFYIPELPSFNCPEALVLNDVPEILAWPEKTFHASAGFIGESTDARELQFTGQIYLYTERMPSQDNLTRLRKEASHIGHRLTFRSQDYMNERNKHEKPLAFISHDSRDKTEIAQRLAVSLEQLLCPVWFDEFTLKVGDSLRENIERGLKTCPKCILILTPNFLANEGWAKREFDSIFTREIVEKKSVILPVWHNVSTQDIYNFSPVLADRVAVDWSLGEKEVARKLFQSINAS